MILINITIYGQHHISIIFNPPFRSNPLHTAPKCRHESSTCESHHRFVAPEMKPWVKPWVEPLSSLRNSAWNDGGAMLMCHQGHFYVWSLGRGPEKHKQLVEQLRKVVCVKPGVPDLPVKVADRLHHSQVGYCKSLPRRLFGTPVPKWLYYYIIWLVVYLPLWKIWVNRKDYSHILWKNNPNVPNHQPDYVYL